jgi:hypothetical protein
MAHARVARRRTDAIRPLPELPAEAGEHDDFAREIATAPPKRRTGRNVWIGGVCLVLVVASTLAVCVRATARWAPIPQEHTLPVR